MTIQGRSNAVAPIMLVIMKTGSSSQALPKHAVNTNSNSQVADSWIEPAPRFCQSD